MVKGKTIAIGKNERMGMRNYINLKGEFTCNRLGRFYYWLSRLGTKMSSQGERGILWINGRDIIVKNG
jgi:hypothetical protein